MDTFADHLRSVRRNARLTQQQLADYLSVDRSVYSMFESGKLVPSPCRLERICDKCAVPPDVRRALAEEAEA